MDTTPRATAEHVAARLAARESSLRERAASASRVARQLSERLTHDFGARAVWLFGSVARGRVHERSDIDLAVAGLSPMQLAEAAAALDAAAAPFNVDLLALERLPATWRAAVERDGVRLA